MPPELASLTIERIIIHDVPYHKKGSAPAGPTLSEIESTITPELALFFSERIKETMASADAFAVTRDPKSKSPVPQLISSLLNGSPNFVAASQTAAKHLHSIQTGVNPGGLLAIVDCRFRGPARGFAVLKLEREEGVRLEHELVQGKTTFQLSHLRDLILTEKTKLYKIGLFVQKGNDVVGTVCDRQRGYLPRVEIASFFLSDFLGFQLQKEPSISTKRFYEVAEDFINKAVTDPVDQAKYHGHLISEMASNRSSVNPRRFANDYLKVSDRQSFIAYLSDNDAPVTSFPKDLELIEARLRTTILEFESGIQVRGTKGALDEKLRLQGRGGREVEATIRDKLKRVRNT